MQAIFLVSDKGAAPQNIICYYKKKNIYIYIYKYIIKIELLNKFYSLQYCFVRNVLRWLPMVLLQPDL